MDRDTDGFDDNQREIDPRGLSGAAFAAFGNGQLAYIKDVVVDGQPAFAIHAADGRPLAVIADRETAFALVRQNDLEPMSVQ